ncbi:MAG: SPOR domain-containing protein [Proteobacteria bacterium]|nr:SPOR domain-containing protein [Pseudomonadota bacterium]
MTHKLKKKATLDNLPHKNPWGWICVFFLVSGSMFFLGILVGRGTAPLKFDIDELQQELSSFKKTFTIESTETRPEKLSDQPELEFFDALKHDGDDKELNIKIIKQAPLPISKEDYEPQPESESAEDKNDIAPDTQITTPIKEDKGLLSTEQTKLPPPAENEKTIPDNLEKDGRYTIQVAAFRQADDADRLVKKLSSKGYHAYRSIGKVTDKGIWFRVRIGAYGKREQAKPVLERLEKDKIKGILLNK